MINTKRSPWPAETISLERARNVAQSLDEMLFGKVFFCIFMERSFKFIVSLYFLKCTGTMLFSL